MKCPKCGYLGFETTDRCRNCQYDFSLAPFTSDPELALQDNDRPPEANPDFDLPPIRRQTDALGSNALDLDRLFGDPESSMGSTGSTGSMGFGSKGNAGSRGTSGTSGSTGSVPTITVIDDDEIEVPLDEPVEPMEPMELAEPNLLEPMAPVERVEPSEPSDLPFDDAPLVPPPAAKPPLAVRRSTPEVPKNRPRTTRPVKPEPLALEPEKPARPGSRGSATDTVASLMETPPLAVRVAAGLIDVLLLLAIDIAVLYLTLRISGLQNTLADVRVLPPVPFVAFLAVLSFGYVAAFTVAGGQTIGKMVMNLRVIGDDGRPIDAAGGMLRAVGCMLVPMTLGLSYVPALVTSDHRALHDRLAGTRVVRE